MKIISTIILVVLVLLAVISGFTKVTLVQQEVEFFERYGFSNPTLVAYGLFQLIGGLMMVFGKTRFAGAAIVAFTFLISLILLLIEGNLPVSAATIVTILLLGVILKQNLKAVSVKS
jgi:hypothetical protein